MTDRPRVLLVAVGGYGSNYLLEMTERDTGADIAGICEVMPDIADKFPVIRERNIPVYHDVEAFYAVDSADLAVISAPIHFHASIARACFAHGSHVLCEKPLCLTEAEADDLALAARAANRFLGIGYQLNYRRDVLALKEDILSGRFGAPQRMQVIHAMRRGKKYYARNNWAGHITVNGREVLDSPFSNACAHNFQLMTFLLGRDMRSACNITGLDAELYRGNPALENFDIAALRFHTEAGVPILYYTAHPLATKNLGPRGVLEFERGTVTFGFEGPDFIANLDDGTTINYGLIDQGERLQKLYDAIECVKHGGAPICGVEAEYPHIRAVRMVQECPIRQIPQERTYLADYDGDAFLCVRNLEETFVKSAEAWALPGEIGIALDA